jgi:N-acetylmuramoyl-L-alanine amidase
LKHIVSLVVLAVFPFMSFNADNGKHYSIKTVVIDPGHGGHDSGCLGSSSKEKDVALAISLKLGKFIEENFKDIRVIYTRKTDVFIELHERAEIANNNKADLFICIHCNSGPKEAFGTETYVMGLHRSENNLNVAKRENAAILMESDYKVKYDGFDPNSPEANIIFTLYQNAFLDQSLALSSQIQKQFKEKLGRYSRGVKQAGFLVLYKTTMPSILIETGFLTNLAEEKFLSSDTGQENIAESIFKAFKLYKRGLESNGGISEKEEEGGSEKEIPKKEANAVKNETIKPKVLHIEKTDTVKLVKKHEETRPKPDTSNSGINKNTVQNDTTKIKIVFKVQLGSSPDLEVLKKKSYKELKDVHYEKRENNTYVLYYGETPFFKEVVEMQSEARRKGFKDAFVVAFKDRQRITIQDALSFLKKK